MNLFKRRTTWSNAELVIIKLSILSAGILIGNYFNPLITGYLSVLWVVFVVTVVPGVWLWISKMKNNKI